MRVLPLLFACAFAQTGVVDSQCALGLQFLLRFDLDNDTTVAAVASSLGWQLDEDSTKSYSDAAQAQAKKDISASFPEVTDLWYSSGISSSSSGNLSAQYYSSFSVGFALCDDKLATPRNTLAANLENALLNPASAIRTKNVFWNYFVGNESFSYSNQFKFEIVWIGTAIKNAGWDSATSDNDVRTTLGVVANATTRVRAPTFGGGSTIDFFIFRAAVEVAIDAQTDAPYTSDPTRWDVYNLIRAAILDPTSTLRTTDKYFKVWMSPTSITGAPSSFAVLQPLWALLAALVAFA